VGYWLSCENMMMGCFTTEEAGIFDIKSSCFLLATECVEMIGQVGKITGST
jgi:hypothetical protein